MKFILLLIISAFAKEIQKSYYLNADSLFHTPSYTRKNHIKIEKRWNTFEYYEFNTTSFFVGLYCIRPFNEPGEVSQICKNVGLSFIKACKYIEQQINLPNTVTIEATWGSFCDTPDQSPYGTPCSSEDTKLGSAAPNGMHILDKITAKKYKLDPNYGYPTSLMRQYIQNQTELGTDKDIVAKFNSDYNWLLANHTYGDNIPWGDVVTINGGFYNQSNYVSYDLEQVATHEILHGMGFVSSWSSWNVPGMTEFDNIYLPSYPDYNANGTLTGILPDWIFTRNFSDRFNGVWVSSYSKAIRDSISLSFRLGGVTKWAYYFVHTIGYNISKAMISKDGLFTTPLALLTWYPTSETNNMTFAVLNTPSTLQPGSSVSHLDAGVYEGILGYLMRPVATRKTLLRKFVPSQKNGLGDVILGIFRAMGYAVYS